MADSNAQRLVIRITGDTSEIEAKLKSLKSLADRIASVSGANKASVISADIRRQTAAETNASRERQLNQKLEIEQAKALNRERSVGRRIAAQPIAGAVGMSADFKNQQALLSSLDQRVANLRRDSKAAGMEIYRNIGNPFLVISSMSQRITGIYQIQRDAEAANLRVEKLKTLFERARKEGWGMADAIGKMYAKSVGEAENFNKKLTGTGMKLRAVGDFFVNQFMTAGLFVWFQAMSMAVMALMEFGGKVVEQIVNPMGVATKKAEELAGVIDKFGGLKKVAIRLDMSEEDRNILENALAALEQRKVFDLRLATEKAKTQTLGLKPGEYTKDEINRLRLERALQLTGGGEGLVGDINRFLGFGLQFGARKEAGMSLGTDAQIQQQARADYGRQLVSLAREGAELSKQQLDSIREMYGLEGQRLVAAYQSIQAEKSRTAELSRQRDELERQRFALTGNRAGLFGADTSPEGLQLDQLTVDMKASQDRVARLQARLDAASRASQYAQGQRSIFEARSEVVRAGIARPGVSGFERAAAMAEARMRQREVERQISEQRYQSSLMEKIAKENAKQSDYDRQVNIIRNGMELAMAEWELTLTVDPSGADRLAGKLTPAKDRRDLYRLPGQ